MATRGRSHLKLLQWFIKNLLLQPQAIDQIFSHMYPTAWWRSQPVFSTDISESTGLKENSLLSHSHPNLFSPEFCNSLSDTITFSHHMLLHCYSAQMLTPLKKKFNNTVHYPLTSISGNLGLSKLTKHLLSHYAVNRTCFSPAFPKQKRGHEDLIS